MTPQINGSGVRDGIGNLSTPWVILPLLAAAAGRRHILLGAAIGLLTTMTALSRSIRPSGRAARAARAVQRACLASSSVARLANRASVSPLRAMIIQ